MEDIKEIKAKLAKIEDFMSKAAVELALYNAGLSEHMRRTEIVEAKLERHDRVIITIVAIGGFITSACSLLVMFKQLHVF